MYDAVMLILNSPQMLKHAQETPGFSNYLTYLLSSTQQPPSITLPSQTYDTARSAAAIMLKNRVKSSYKQIPETDKSYIRSVILQGLQDPSVQIRSYAGNVITEIVRQGGILAWPRLLSDLFALIENKDGQFTQQTQEGAMGALLKICEDNKRALDRDYSGERPLAFIFPKLLEFTTNPLTQSSSHSVGEHQRIRSGEVSSCNQPSHITPPAAVFTCS